jgi:rhodanese-related sulfurtransferase
VDLRDPASFGQGHLPAALLLPGRQILSRIEALASPGQDITLYDADGEGTSVELAAELRRRGFLRARRLVGGFAEWLREGEPIARPETVAGAAHQIGDAVRLLDGRSAVVQGLRVEGGTSLYTLLFDVYEDPLLDVEASSLEVG